MRVPVTAFGGRRQPRNGHGDSRNDPTSAGALLEAPQQALASDGRKQRKLSVIVQDFARVIDARVVLVSGLDARRQLHVTSLWGIDGALPVSFPKPGGTGRARARPGPGGCFVGRALAHRRPAFETLKADRDAALIHTTRPALTHALATPIPSFDAETDDVLVALFSSRPTDFRRALWIADSYALVVALIKDDVDAFGELMAQSRHRDGEPSAPEHVPAGVAGVCGTGTSPDARSPVVTR